MTGDSQSETRTLADRLGRIRRLIRKELAEILRDRRTILTLLFMPVLLYPLVAIGFQQYLLGRRLEQGGPVYRLGFRTQAEADCFTTYLALGQRALEHSGAWTAQTNDDSPPTAPPHVSIRPQVEQFEVVDPEQALRQGQIDIFLQSRGVPPRRVLEHGPLAANRLALDWEAIYRADSANGLDALRFLERVVAASNEQYLAARLQALGEPQRDRPFRLVAEARVDPNARLPSTLAVLVPLVLILMTITGAVYPAIDLTAGERERGTLEVLVAAPIPRLSVLFAKYVAVLVVAMLTAGVNLGAMTLTLWATGMGQVLLAGQAVGWIVFVQVVSLLLLFAAFFSAVLLALTSFARSFKEAQAYLVPLMLVSMTPGMVGLIPGVELSGLLAVTPLLNVVLLARDLIAGHAEAAPAAIVILSTMLYAAAALGLAARVFGAEAVLYSQTSSWGDLFRRPRRPVDAPRASTALFTLALMFPLNFLIVYAPLHLPALPFAATLFLGLLANLFLFAAVPGFVLWLGRIRVAPALALRLPGMASCLAAVLLGLSLWPLSHLLNVALRELGLTLLTEEHLAKLREGLVRWREVSSVLVVGLLGVVVPLLEELFFRGFLFGALQQRLLPWATILTTAALFGVFHIFSPVGLTPERFLVTTLMGVALGWTRWRTDSVVPGILLHMLHNSSIVLLGYFQPQLIEAGWLPAADTLPPTWASFAFSGCAVGLLVIGLTTRGRIAPSN